MSSKHVPIAPCPLEATIRSTLASSSRAEQACRASRMEETGASQSPKGTSRSRCRHLGQVLWTRSSQIPEEICGKPAFFQAISISEQKARYSGELTIRLRPTRMCLRFFRGHDSKRILYTWGRLGSPLRRKGAPKPSHGFLRENPVSLCSQHARPEFPLPDRNPDEVGGYPTCLRTFVRCPSQALRQDGGRLTCSFFPHDRGSYAGRSFHRWILHTRCHGSDT